MTTLTFRRLRQAELVKWFQMRYGENWRSSLSIEMQMPVVRTYRWFKDDISGRIQAQIEAWAYANGFVSIYDESLAEYHHHGLILEDIMTRVNERLTKEGKADIIAGAAFPLRTDELNQLHAGLNYRLVSQR